MRRICVFLLALTCVSATNVNKLFRQVLEDHVVLFEDSEGYCTAVMVKPDTFLTANHCLSDSPIQLEDEFHLASPADVIKLDEELDLALLHAKVARKTPIKFASIVKPQDYVMAIGYTAIFRDTPSVSSYKEGRVLAHDGDVVVSDFAFRAGYSGGPLVNAKGELVGINVMSNAEKQLGLSVYIPDILTFLEKK